MPRCKHCNEKFEQYQFNNKFCKELDCQVQKGLFLVDKQQKQKLKEINKDVRERKQKLKTKQNYEKELEVIFKRFFRMRDLELPCISCNKPAGQYKLTAGHFHPAGTYKNIRFNEDNVHGQCWFNCNKNKHGNLSEYRPALIKRIGQDRVDEIDRLRNIPAKYTIPELIIMKENYKEKIRNLK